MTGERARNAKPNPGRDEGSGEAGDRETDRIAAAPPSPAPPLPRLPTHRVFIGLGSNIEAEENLPAAVRMLGRYGDVTAASAVYETIPVRFTAQANFLNAAVLFETDRPLAAVLGEIVPTIERSLGRRRDPANPSGPRTIDLDVALFDDLVTGESGRTLPDPDILRYPFVAIPLAELDPNYVHPTDGRTLAAIAVAFAIPADDMRPRPDVTLL